MKALEFASDGPDGLVVKLGRVKSKTDRTVMKFECEKFSCFEDERETLFFGGDTELGIKGIIQWANGNWNHYDKYMEPINALNRMINGKFLGDQLIWNSMKSQKWMNAIIIDLIRRQLSQTGNVVVDIPQYISSLVKYQMSLAEHIRLNWNEMKSGYEWMSGILKSDDNLLDIPNLSVLFADSSSITFVVSDGADLEEKDWESVVNGLSIVNEMGLFMKFRFELSSDDSRENEMHMMAQGYLDMNQSKWQCRHDLDGKVLIFNVVDTEDSEIQTLIFRERAEFMIQRLQEAIGNDNK